MGRRRQHSGGLALASDQIPGLAQHNIHSGLVTFQRRLCQAFRKPTSICYSRLTKKGKFETKPLVGPVSRPAAWKAVGGKKEELHESCRTTR